MKYSHEEILINRIIKLTQKQINDNHREIYVDFNFDDNGCFIDVVSFTLSKKFTYNEIMDYVNHGMNEEEILCMILQWF